MKNFERFSDNEPKTWKYKGRFPGEFEDKDTLEWTEEELERKIHPIPSTRKKVVYPTSVLEIDDVDNMLEFYRSMQKEYARIAQFFQEFRTEFVHEFLGKVWDELEENIVVLSKTHALYIEAISVADESAIKKQLEEEFPGLKERWKELREQIRKTNRTIKSYLITEKEGRNYSRMIFAETDEEVGNLFMELLELLQESKRLWSDVNNFLENLIQQEMQERTLPLAASFRW